MTSPNELATTLASMTAAERLAFAKSLQEGAREELAEQNGQIAEVEYVPATDDTPEQIIVAITLAKSPVAGKADPTRRFAASGLKPVKFTLPKGSLNGALKVDTPAFLRFGKGSAYVSLDK